MKSVLFVLAALASVALANTAPTVVIQSAAMRPGTTLMDVVYRVNDPDDATVKTRALAFVDGVRSFAKVIKPVSFVEGTAAKLGDAIPANVDHTLTWDVAADWNIDLGQVKFEVLAMDGRGLLPFDWITVPAAGGNPALTISKDAPSGEQILNGLFWQFAAGDTGLELVNGVLRGTAASGVFAGIELAVGGAVQSYAAPFLFKRMNLDPATTAEVSYAAGPARAGLLNTNGYHAAGRPYEGFTILLAWGANSDGQSNVPAGLSGVTAIAAGGNHSLALMGDGTVAAWGDNWGGQSNVPAGLSGVTAIAAGWDYSLALKGDGTVVAWGANSWGQSNVPAGLSGVTAIAAGGYHSLALKGDGTVVAWGSSNNTNDYGQCDVPAGLSGVTAIAASGYYSLALKGDGTVVAWGANWGGQSNVPAGLSGVTAIAAGWDYSLALKGDGTVVAWGANYYDQSNVPAGLSGVTAIAAGGNHSLALKGDGTVVAWGANWWGQSNVPAGLSGVTAIAAGGYHSLALKGKAP